MALSPIQMFQQQQNPLEQILAGGNQAITGIFDRAIQIGRDMSNKQLQQEQDMLAMRNSETNMAQRRAENLQQNNEDAIKFARGAFEVDRKFGVDQTQQQFQNTRVTAQDLFSNQQSVERTGIAVNADTRAEEDQRMRRDALKLAQDQQKQERDNFTRMFSGGDKAPSTESAPPFVDQENPANVGTAAFGPDGNETPATTLFPSQEAGSASDAVKSKMAELTRQQGYWEGQSTNKNLTSAQRSAAGAEANKFKSLYDLAKIDYTNANKTSSAKPPDPTRQEINKLILNSKQEEQNNQFTDEFVNANPGAFPNSYKTTDDFVKKEAVRLGVKEEDVIYNKEFGKKEEDTKTDDEVEQIRTSYKESSGLSQGHIEKNAIKRAASEAAYVKLGPPEQAELRRTLYRRWKGQGGTPTTSAAPSAPSAPGPDTRTAKQKADDEYARSLQ